MIQTAPIAWARPTRPLFYDPATTVLDHSPAPVIGIAGAGRQLAAELVAGMLADAGLTTVSGWPNALDRLAVLTPEARIVVDVGPHVDWAEHGRLSILAVVGLAGDELDEGEDAERYHAALGQIIGGVQRELVISATCTRSVLLGSQASVALRRVSTATGALPSTAAWLRSGEIIARDPLLGIERRVCRVADTAFVGTFLTNLLLVSVATALAAGATVEAVRKVAQGSALADHAQTVATRRRVRWICDAAATRPGQAASTVLGLEPAAGSLFVLAGGRYGGQSLTRWAGSLRAAGEAVLLFGSAANTLAEALLAASGGAHIIRCADLEDAFGVADRLCGPGDVVLLSPACDPDSLTYPPPAERFRRHLDAGRRARIAA